MSSSAPADAQSDAAQPLFEPSDRPGRRAIADWTLRQLYDLIFSGELASGDVLVEAALTKRLGVSRSPLREALRQLELDRLVTPDEVNGRRIVTAFGIDDVAELYTVRAALESLAARSAAERIGDDDLAELRRLQGQMESVAAEARPWQPRDFEPDFRFHELIARVSKMPRLQGQLSTLWIQTWALLQQLNAAGIYPDQTEDVMAFTQHHEIIAALAARDAQLASAAVERHLTERRDHLIAAVRQHGGLPNQTSTER
jgi:DNA-binding GntR family transcriptional regulator